MTSLAIYIPAYNVGYTLPRVLERIPKELSSSIKEILIVDNASTDNTYITAVEWKKKHKNIFQNVHIIKNQENKGYGGSQKIAYQYCIGKGYDYVVMLHGDAQYAPEFILQLLEKAKETNADLVFGSRMKGNPLQGGMPVWRFAGNNLLTWIENVVLDMELSEFHSGYSLYKVEALKRIPFIHCSDNYFFDSQILIQMRLANMKIEEVEIPTYYAKDTQSPTVVQTAQYAFSILAILGRYILHKYNIKKSKIFDI